MLLTTSCVFVVKTNPPTALLAISEQAFPTSLLMNWTRPLNERYLSLMYEIRFRAAGSQSWNYVSMTVNLPPT